VDHLHIHTHKTFLNDTQFLLLSRKWALWLHHVHGMVHLGKYTCMQNVWNARNTNTVTLQWRPITHSMG